MEGISKAKMAERSKVASGGHQTDDKRKRKRTPSSSKPSVKKEEEQSAAAGGAAGAAGQQDEEDDEAVVVGVRPPPAATPKKKRGGGSRLSATEGQKSPKTVVEKEKRPFPTRRSSAPFVQRLQRALTQRMYLVRYENLSHEGDLHYRFHIAGSTGNVYHTDICGTPSCSCPDFARHAARSGVVCKHLCLTYARILRLPLNSHIMYQKGLLQSELREAFRRLPQQHDDEEERALAGVLASPAARAAYTKHLGGDEEEEEEEQKQEKQVEEVPGLAGEDECPVCLEEFNVQRPEAVVICVTCHKPTHTVCMRTWNAVRMQEGLPMSCVFCRSEWVDPASASLQGKTGGGLKVSNEGDYLNVGELTGQSARRDTSTYSEAGMRWRYGRRGGW